MTSHFTLTQLCPTGVLSILWKVKLRLEEQKQLVRKLSERQSWHSDSAQHLFASMILSIHDVCLSACPDK